MIQIDMQMPESCDVCPFNYDFCWCVAFGDYDNWEKYSDDWNDNVCERTTRPEYCPLKEQDCNCCGTVFDVAYKAGKADAVIRCKDCKWFHQAFKSEGRCLKHDNDYHEPDWFCADAERRD